MCQSLIFAWNTELKSMNKMLIKFAHCPSSVANYVLAFMYGKADKILKMKGKFQK